MDLLATLYKAPVLYRSPLLCHSFHDCELTRRQTHPHSLWWRISDEDRS
ncbi:hypothetical protein [Planctopirus hydrillae]|nr:hypothetical protein [Planctopirus hydrillae]